VVVGLHVAMAAAGGAAMALTSFKDFFAELGTRHGPEAAEVRHELFFLARRRFGGCQGWLALVRDVFLLNRPLTMVAMGPEPLAILVATLSGVSGWGSLVRALPSIRAAGLRPVILAHPRLPDSLFPSDLPVLKPGGLSLGDVAAAAGGTVSPVAAALARRRLWGGAVRRCLAGHRGVLLLHNDFDMMSASSLLSGWPSICLQHGVPTDEFFPCRADHQVVWGESSFAAYVQSGVDSTSLVVDSLGRGAQRAGLISLPPAGIAVVSQTHAAIFDPALPQCLIGFVEKLRHLEPDVRVLLHPGERGCHPYGGALVSMPPHKLLNECQPSLVIAYCSTFALDAALAGHWVASLKFPLPGNALARGVASPPLCVEGAEEAIALQRRLMEDAPFRQDMAARQEAWLDVTFTPKGGQLEELLRSVGRSCLSF
jgi:hypothetical protein